MEYHTGDVGRARNCLKDALECTRPLEGSFLDVLFGGARILLNVNPAILTMVHAYDHKSCEGETGFMPAPLPALTASSSACADLQQAVPEEGRLQHIVGEVYWLFDEGAANPYLAEVFTEGVPDERLPHVRQRTVVGGHIARVLGVRQHYVRVVPHAKKKYLFTKWCVQTIVYIELPHLNYQHCQPPPEFMQEPDTCTGSKARQLPEWASQAIWDAHTSYRAPVATCSPRSSGITVSPDGDDLL
jgi:hypothetical protein